MGKNAIKVMQEGNKALDQINGKLNQTVTNVLAINDAALKLGKNFFNIKTPQGLNENLNSYKGIITQVNAEVRERNRLEKALQNQLAKNAQANSRVAKSLAVAKFEQQQLNQANRDAAVLSSKLASEYQKQTVILNQLRKRYKDVALTQGESSKAAKKLLTQVTALDNRLKRVDSNVGQFQRSVGNYGKAMQGAVGAARNLAGALGLIGGAFLAVRVVKDAIRVIKDFEKGNATLSAILQVEKKEMKGLTDESQRLGSTTVKTAGEVTQLQIAFARLGFSQNEIIDLTEATISGSIAMNSELSATANLVGAVVNTFDDFSAIDAPKIIDILSLSTAKSALNFSKLETGIPIVAGAANAAGVPFTKLVALMGKLSDSGIDVSTSSTALRNIFIEAAKDGSDYGEILETIKGSTDKLTASNDEFGKRAAVSAAVLAQNIDATKELDEALQGAAGTAQSMADKELDTLDGALQLLKSAWEGVILETDDANSISVQLKETIQSLAKNLGAILSTLFKVVKLYVLYKAAVFAVNLATGAWAAANKAVTFSLAVLRGGITGVIASLRAMKLATAATGIGLFLVALGSAYAIWQDFKDGANDAAKAQKDFNDEVERMEGLSDRFTKALSKVAAGRERANAAVAEQFASEDRLVKNLKNQAKIEEGTNKGRLLGSVELAKAQKRSANSVSIALEKLKTLRGEDNQTVKDKIDLLDVLSVKEKELVTDAIIVQNSLSRTINKNNALADSEDKKNKELENTKTVLKGSIVWYEKIIKLMEDQRDNLSTNTEEYKKYNEQIGIAKNRLKDLKNGLEKVNELETKGINTGFVLPDENEIQAGVDRELAFQERKFEILKEYGQDFYSFMQGLGDDNLDYIKDLSDDQIKIFKDAFDAQVELKSELNDTIKDLAFTSIDSIFEKRVVDVDREIELNNEKYSALLDNENLNEQQRSAIEAQRDAKNIQLEKKRQKAEKTAFLVKQGLAVAEIALNLAKTITAINLAAATMDALTFGVAGTAYKAVNIPLAIGTAAAQTGVVLAQAIPQFEKGKGEYDNYEGAAIWGEKRQEAKISKDGSVEISPKTIGNHLTHVKKDDIIHPDASKFLSNLSDQELYNNLHKHTILASMSHQKQTIDNYLVAQSMNKAYEKQTNRMIKAMESNRPRINVHNNNSIGDDLNFLADLNKY